MSGIVFHGGSDLALRVRAWLKSAMIAVVIVMLVVGIPFAIKDIFGP